MQVLQDIKAASPFIAFLIQFMLWVGPVVGMIALWRVAKVKPGRRMILCAFAWLAVGVLASIFADLQRVWIWGLCAWMLLALIDLVVVLRVKPLELERVMPGRFAINVEGVVELTLRNRSKLPLRVHVYDGLPEEAESEALPWSGEIPARGFVTIHYPVKFCERGKSSMDAAHVEYLGLFQFWQCQRRVGHSDETRVYPNYEPVIQYALLAMESSPEQMGIVKKNRAGMSKDFHQLRDFQLGDTLSRVDWKATSKKLELISRDYQETRDQNVILAVDCGQRMRAMDGEIPQFDHCLNAMLLLAYVALKQGDNVGVLSFGGQERWLPPVKGVNSMTTILNHLYDYQTSTNPSDYAEAAERLLVRQRRRSLVVFLSNVRGEDGADLIEPLRMVRRRHVVVLANLREKEVMDRMAEPVESLDDALAVAASQQYLDDRRLMLNELSSHGVITVDETAQQLPVALANSYLMAREKV